MLIVRQAQMGALSIDRMQGFEQALLEHVTKRHALMLGALGIDRTRSLIRQCADRCLAAGLSSPMQITVAIDSMFRQQDRLLASPDDALNAVMREQEASELRSLLETVSDL